MRKHEKTRKSRENTSEKVAVGNTFEQYSGLKSCAASPFFNIYFINIEKAENRHFPESEQYGRLESAQPAKLAIQAARSRAWEPPWPASWPGFQGYPQGAKSRKVAILATLLVPSRTGPEGRLGPPESIEKPEKSGKERKRPKWPFLRVTRAIGRPRAHSVPWAPSRQSSGSQGHSVPASLLHYAGSLGLLEPKGRNRTLDGCSVFRAFPGPSPGP